MRSSPDFVRDDLEVTEISLSAVTHYVVILSSGTKHVSATITFLDRAAEFMHNNGLYLYVLFCSHVAFS